MSPWSVLRVAAAGPFLWLLLFWAFVLRARLALGYWPAPYRPDPEDLGFLVHHYALLGTMPLALLGVAAAFVLVVPWATRPAGTWRARALPALGAALFLVWVRTDPGRFLYWFGD
jgi:hypothetical protein